MDHYKLHCRSLQVLIASNCKRIKYFDYYVTNVAAIFRVQTTTPTVMYAKTLEQLQLTAQPNF
jgi:hypothetical protein